MTKAQQNRFFEVLERRLLTCQMRLFQHICLCLCVILTNRTSPIIFCDFVGLAMKYDLLFLVIIVLIRHCHEIINLTYNI
jgi:hypothetical protein